MRISKNNDVIEDLIVQHATPSNTWMLSCVFGRVGMVLSNVSIALLLVGILMSLATILSGVITFIFLLFLLVFVLLALVFTLGLILLAMPDEIKSLFSIQETLIDITALLGTYAVDAAPFVLGVSAMAALVSVVFLALDRRGIGHGGRILFSCFVLVLGTLAFAFVFFEGGAAV